MKGKIFIAGVWGFGNISVMRRFQDESDVEFLENDFAYYLPFQKVWQFASTWFGRSGKKAMHALFRTPVFDSKYELSHCRFEENDENLVVIFNSALLQYYSREYFQRLKKKHDNIRYFLYIIDPMPDGIWEEIKEVLPVFEKVLTIHPYNAQRYGFQYLPYIYEKPVITDRLKGIPKVDLFFCGVANEHRQSIIRQIMEECKLHSITYDFWLKPYGNNRITDDHITYLEMPYEENVQHVEHAGCILEIMHEGFVGITQRYLEAIIYNKKLLTNNREIKNLPYYCEDFMQYFEHMEDIDWEWVRDDRVVNYHYQGDFGAKAWKKRLLQLAVK